MSRIAQIDVAIAFQELTYGNLQRMRVMCKGSGQQQI